MKLDYWNREDFVPKFSVKIDFISLVQNAKITDFIHFSPFMWGCPFLISSKGVELFNNFSLPVHFYYPVNLFNGNVEIKNYTMIYLPYFGFNAVDFSKCIFSSGYELLNNVRDYRFNSFEEYKSYKGGLNERKIKLKEKSVEEFDILNLRLGGLFFSERLKDKIEDVGLSGLAYLSNIEVEV